MKVVHSWLNELAPLGDDIDKLAETMTDLGLAVEEIVHVGATVDGVITARVVRTERHPDAAKVHRVYVDAGDGRERHVALRVLRLARRHRYDLEPLQRKQRQVDAVGERIGRVAGDVLCL